MLEKLILHHMFGAHFFSVKRMFFELGLGPHHRPEMFISEEQCPCSGVALEKKLLKKAKYCKSKFLLVLSYSYQNELTTRSSELFPLLKES